MARRKSTLVRALLLTRFAAQLACSWQASVCAQAAAEERRRAGGEVGA